MACDDYLVTDIQEKVGQWAAQCSGSDFGIPKR
jgi:hypothetical protein